MTLLTICQQVTDAVGLTRPSAVASATDQLARQLLTLANETLEELSEDNWPRLKRTTTIAVVAGTDTYSLPTDFLRIVPRAIKNTNNNRLSGSLTSGALYDQNRLDAYNSLAGIKYSYRLTGDPYKLVLYPVPQVSDTLTIEYITENTVVAIDGVTYYTQYTVDDDTSLVPERLVRMGLKWRIKHAKGLDYSEDFNVYENARKTEYSQMLDLDDIPVSVRAVVTTGLADPTVAENGFG